MRRRHLFVLGVVLALAVVAPAFAAGVGPQSDFRGSVGPSTTDPASFTIIINTQFWKIRDQIIINFPPSYSALSVGGVGYASDPNSSGNRTITTVYGLNTATPESPLSLNGLPPGPVFHDEKLFGDSGTYPSTALGALTYDQLIHSSALTGLDLSPFLPTAGAPNAVFYAFQADVPAGDLTGVPVPAALPVGLAMGGMGIIARFWQRRRANAA